VVHIPVGDLGINQLNAKEYEYEHLPGFVETASSP
jgi:hypothetical protein